MSSGYSTRGSNFGIMTFAKAKTTLGKRSSKKIGNNTYLQSNHDGTIGIRFHSTEIVMLFEDGTIEFDNGGYRSMTTKERLNAFTPFSFEQKKHEWFVHTRTGLYAFERHMRFDQNHNPVPNDSRRPYRKIGNDSSLNRSYGDEATG